MEALNTPAQSAPSRDAGRSLLRPSRGAVLALAAYVPLAFVATLVAGDLGDVGFWFVWIPVVFVLLYLSAAGIVRIAGGRSRR